MPVKQKHYYFRLSENRVFLFLVVSLLLGLQTACDVTWTEQERRAVNTLTALIEHRGDKQHFAKADSQIDPDKLTVIMKDKTTINTVNYLWARKEQGLQLNYSVVSSEIDGEHQSVELNVTEEAGGIIERATPTQGLSYIFSLNYKLSSEGKWHLVDIVVNR